MASKNFEEDFNKLSDDIDRIKEIFCLRLMKANAYSIRWEQIINFLISRLDYIRNGEE